MTHASNSALDAIYDLQVRRVKELEEALRAISNLWPEPPHCAPIDPEWVGERDGKARAILLLAAIQYARKALLMPWQDIQ